MMTNWLKNRKLIIRLLQNCIVALFQESSYPKITNHLHEQVIFGFVITPYSILCEHVENHAYEFEVHGNVEVFLLQPRVISE